MQTDVTSERFWKVLLNYMDAGLVIPVIDSGALLVDAGGRREPLDNALARLLAEQLELDQLADDGTLQLEDVVRAQRAQPRRENLYMHIHEAYKELNPAPPQSLLDLAAIRAFNLFVTLGQDDLLQRAIDAVRFPAGGSTDVLAFNPKDKPDLPVPRKNLVQPTVFHLLGKHSPAALSVICDDDRLEFLHAIQNDDRRPKLLYDALRDSHLLMIGCRLPDWAARFFLRAARGGRLSNSENETSEYLVGLRAADDPALARYLDTFRPRACLVPMAPEAFLAELRQRWEARHPPSGAGPAPAPAPATSDRPEPREGTVFISYSRDDLDTARQLARRLSERGVDVWFDQQELQAGDPWHEKIVQGIARAALFIPVISTATQRHARSRAYFWSEWNTADRLAANHAPNDVFLLPVVIDDVDAGSATVPDEFRRFNWTRAPGGQPDEAFVQRTVDLFRQYRDRIAGP